jgi:SAM-dependent methyltransferase
LNASKCLGCDAVLPVPFLDLGCTPLANSYLRSAQAESKEKTFPLVIAYCCECYLVQLTRRVPPDALFAEYPYFSSYSDTFIKHAEAMAATYIHRFNLGHTSKVLEIASNDGYLLRFFQQHRIPVLGVEPARNIAAEARGRGIPTLERFFGLKVVSEVHRDFGSADIVIGNNVLAHVPEINDFLRAVKACLKDGGVAVFEFPYLKDLLDKTEFDTIYHEHVFYYSLSALEVLASRAGLDIFDVEHHTVHGGSLRLFLQHRGTRPPTERVEQQLQVEAAEGLTNSERYRTFADQVRHVRAELLHLLESLKRSGKRIAAYGAPAKGNTLLNYCGIGCDLLEFTVDRSPHKQGLLLPGSRLPVRAPDTLVDVRPDYVVVLAWNMIDEILSQQTAYLKGGGRFIVPIPRPRILNTYSLSHSEVHSA